MEIRQAETSDHRSIGELILVWDPDTGQRYLSGGASASEREFVALEDGDVIGWISGNHESGSWGNLAAYEDRPESWSCSYIVKLFVSPEKRSNRVGGRLVEAFELDAVAAGRDLVIVFPDESNDPRRVRRFYGNCGYALMEPSQDYARMQPWLMAKKVP